MRVCSLHSRFSSKLPLLALATLQKRAHLVVNSEIMSSNAFFFQFFREFLSSTVAQNYPVDWKRRAFFHFVENFRNPKLSQDLKAKIMTMILIPSLAISFDKGDEVELIGGPPSPYQENDNSVVSVFISRIVDPDNPFDNDESLRIAVLQFACLLVERASPHIHDGETNNKRQGSKLRRLMTFAWPCLLARNCVDPSARYHGHLLLCHIIARLAIHKRIVLQVFHSLLRAHSIEARSIVRQGLEVLTPSMASRMEDGHAMLTHWTKKIIVEEGHSMQQLFHILQLVVRHYDAYYPVRHHLIHHIVQSITRLGFSTTATLEYRRLAVELSEVIIKWELQRIKDVNEANGIDVSDELNEALSTGVAIKRTHTDDGDQARKKVATTTDGSSAPVPSTTTTTTVAVAAKTTATGATTTTPQVEGSLEQIDKQYWDTIVNFLFRLSCQVNEQQQAQIPGIVPPGESLSRRCVALVKLALKPEYWTQPVDLRLLWLDKMFATVGLENQSPNIGNICTGLELLTFLLNILKKEQILPIFRSLQRGLSACVTSSHTRITRIMHNLLSRLMGMYPTDTFHKNDDLEHLYTAVSKMIFEGLANYEKSQAASPSSLFAPLMILKAACTNNQSYIDRLMMPFMRLLNRLTKEHLLGANNAQHQVNATTDGTNSNTIAQELLILSLDLVKNRVVVMGVEIRKLFIGGILVGLIEKTPEVKVMKSIVKIVEDWMKNKDSTVTVTQAPSIREKSILLVKLMHYVEKRFTDDLELNASFLELIYYIYHDDYLKQTELTSKLEVAFLSGLRCNQPTIRAKFFGIFDGSMRRLLHDRLLYIICSQAWDTIGQHYWIKQCIELLILTTNTSTQIRNVNDNHLLPSISSVINLTDSEEKKDFVIYTQVLNDQPDVFDNVEDKEDNFDMDMNVELNISRREESERPVANRNKALIKLISRQAEFLEANRKIRTEQFLVATAQLCHMETPLAESVWLTMFPKVWSLMDDGQQLALTREMVQFLASGTHVTQKDCQPSALNTFVEALSRCKPAVQLPPSLINYLGKSHNLWHRMTLMLEDMCSEWPNRGDNCNDYIDPEVLDTSTDINKPSLYDHLAQMYSIMQEEDLWAGLWMKYAKFPETNTAIAYEQMGFFEEAQGAYDVIMTKYKQEVGTTPTPIDTNSELQLWETHWLRCARELNQWDIILDYAKMHKDKKSLLITDSAWRVPDWDVMKQALLRIEQASSKQEGYRINLYRGYLALMNSEEIHLPTIDRYVEIASVLCMREWRRLPSIVSHMHMPILQAAQQIMELQEACQIHQGISQIRMPTFHDVKAIVKTWRNRLPVIADDLSHWSDIFTWRQHHYQLITAYLEKQTEGTVNTQSMLGVHASAQAIIHFGKIARKQNLTNVCQDSLSRIYTIPSVPIIDCFQKIRQQVKCYLQAIPSSSRTELSEALEVIESTNLRYFSREMTAEFSALKGLLLARSGSSDEANKAFSAATQMNDSLVKAWALWGEYLEQIFTKERQMHYGTSAIICFLQACRSQTEYKSRKYVAKILWLLSYDDKCNTLMDAIDKYSIGIQSSHWLPWISQLLCCLVQYEGTVILNLLSQVNYRNISQIAYQLNSIRFSIYV